MDDRSYDVYIMSSLWFSLKIKLIESMNPDWRDLSSEQGEPVAESGIPRARQMYGPGT
jgi:hypothetical protein